MKLPEIKVSAAPKGKQANVRLTEGQALALKVHCNRTGKSTQEIIIGALTDAVPGFSK